jgi:hypothetical protein
MFVTHNRMHTVENIWSLTVFEDDDDDDEDEDDDDNNNNNKGGTR